MRSCLLGRIILVLMLSAAAGSALAYDYPIPIHRGNGVANLFAKLNSGQSVKIAYIGGSVTENPGWRDNVTNWLKSYYPGKVTEINAGWSGTGSLIGAMRLYRDVLVQSPDLIFVEFAVNDLPEDPLSFVERNCEGIVRQAWALYPMTDICFIETIAYYIEQPYLNGYYPTTVQAHYNVCDHYGCPSVNVGWALYEYVLAGTPWTDLAPDRVHPNAAGHQIYSDAVISYLNSERIRAGASQAHSLPASLTDFPVTGSTITEMTTVSPLPSGWTAHYNEYGVPSYVQSGAAGATISIGFVGPSAAAKVIVAPDAGGGSGLSYSIDGSAYQPANQSVNSWTYVWAFPIAKNLANTAHTVTFKANSGVARIVNVEAATTGGAGLGDAGSGGDAGNTLASALAITPGSYTGHASNTSDPYDYYKFPVAVGQGITCSMTPPVGADFDIYLYNPYGVIRASSVTRGSGTETLSFVADVAGDWRLRVHAYSGSGGYGFAVYVRTMNGSVPTGTNLARTATQWQTDSNYSAEFNGAKAIDGVVSGMSKWTSLGTAPPHWLALDLGGNKVVNGYIVRHAGDGGEPSYYNTEQFKIQSAASLSGPWTDETEVNNAAQANVTNLSYYVPRVLRYVRLYITDAGIDNYARIPEFEVWGSADTTPPTTPSVTDDGIYTTNVSQLHASWSAADPESGIAEYQYAIGTTPGGTDVAAWATAGTSTSVTRSGLSLSCDQTYYFNVKARNGAGIWSAVGSSDGITVARIVQTVAEAKSYPDSSAVQLAEKVVSANIGSMLWLEELDRSAGIGVNSTAYPAYARITVTGRLATVGGARLLDQPALVHNGTTPVPQPLVLTTRDLGGGRLNQYTPGVKDGTGANNIGLLVQVFGRVTQTDSGYFYIDDGAGLRDGSQTGATPNVGVRVLSPPGTLSTGDVASIKGISTCFESAGEYARAILPLSDGITKL